jgi:Bacterial regulatory helix-turn-helix protein, lysR family
MNQRTAEAKKTGNEPPNLVVGRSNVSLKQIWAFLSVAETGNFTKSAEALHTTQSAISTLI